MNIRAWETPEENMKRNREENPEIYKKLDEALEEIKETEPITNKSD